MVRCSRVSTTTTGATALSHHKLLAIKPRSGVALDRSGLLARGDGRPDVDLAVISRTPKLEPARKLADWIRHRTSLGRVGVGVDLAFNGWQVAAHLAQSRWHVMGDVRPATPGDRWQAPGRARAKPATG